MNVTERLAVWAAEASAADIPEAVRDRARLQTASVAAAMLAGARTEAGARVRRAATGWGAADEATVIPTGERLPVGAACYVNAASSIVLDYDDYLFAGHTGHSAAVAALTYGESVGGSADDVLVAQVVANELAGRLGAAFLLGPHNGQMWTYIHALAGAVVAGRFLGLDARAMRHAIAIALAQPPYPLAPSFFGPGSKTLFAAEPLGMGLRAASLAAEGLTGADDILGGKDGFLATVASRALPFVFGGLGTTWLTASLAFKRYPGCAYIDTAVDAFEAIAARYADDHGRPLRPDDVAAVHVAATLFTDGMEQMAARHRRDDALRAVDVNFSVGLSLGVLLAGGEISAETLSEQALTRNADAIRGIASRVTVEQAMDLNARMSGLADVGIDTLRLFEPAYEPSFEDLDFSRFRISFPARVTVRTAEGTELVEEVEVPRGAPGRPWREILDDVGAKFLREGKACRIADAEATLEAILAGAPPRELVARLTAR